MKKLIPDYKFDRFSDVTVDFLISLGIKGVVLDIDNTLEPYENLDPGKHVIDWILKLKDLGISCAFVSNNEKERVERFNKDLSLPAYYKAKKPFRKNVLRAIEDMGVKKCEALLMGDQIFTDALGANCAGVRSVLVRSIDNHTWLLKLRHVAELPFIRMAKNRRIPK